MIFGDQPVNQVTHLNGNKVKSKSIQKSGIVKETGISEGYCLVLGGENIKQLKELVYESKLNVVVYEKDPERVQTLREYFDKEGVKTERLSFQHFGGKFPEMPKYFSSLTLINDLFYLNNGDKDVLEKMYESTRPYGGKIVITSKGKQQDI